MGYEVPLELGILLLAGLSCGKSYINGYLLLLEKAEIVDFPQPSAPESSYDLRIELGSPALQADSLPTELPGKP